MWNASTENDIDQIFTDISTHNPQLRKHAAHQLHEYVCPRIHLSLEPCTNRIIQVISRASRSKHGSPDEWEEAVGKRLLNIIQSNESSHKHGAIVAIGITFPPCVVTSSHAHNRTDVMLEIIKEDPIDNRRNLFRFYNYLTTLLRDTSESSVVVAASHSLGRLTQISGAVLGDRFVEEQIPNFLEMVSSDATSPYGAVLVLKELARSSPTSFLPRLSDTFRSVSILLRNSQVISYNPRGLGVDLHARSTFVKHQPS